MEKICISASATAQDLVKSILNLFACVFKKANLEKQT
jgi:hypothetical protein